MNRIYPRIGALVMVLSYENRVFDVNLFSNGFINDGQIKICFSFFGKKNP